MKTLPQTLSADGPLLLVPSEPSVLDSTASDLLPLPTSDSFDPLNLELRQRLSQSTSSIPDDGPQQTAPHLQLGVSLVVGLAAAWHLAAAIIPLLADFIAEVEVQFLPTTGRIAALAEDLTLLHQREARYRETIAHIMLLEDCNHRLSNLLLGRAAEADQSVNSQLQLLHTTQTRGRPEPARLALIAGLRQLLSGGQRYSIAAHRMVERLAEGHENRWQLQHNTSETRFDAFLAIISRATDRSMALIMGMKYELKLLGQHHPRLLEDRLEEKRRQIQAIQRRQGTRVEMGWGLPQPLRASGEARPLLPATGRPLLPATGRPLLPATGRPLLPATGRNPQIRGGGWRVERGVHSIRMQVVPSSQLRPGGSPALSAHLGRGAYGTVEAVTVRGGLQAASPATQYAFKRIGHKAVGARPSDFLSIDWMLPYPDVFSSLTPTSHTALISSPSSPLPSG